MTDSTLTLDNFVLQEQFKLRDVNLEASSLFFHFLRNLLFSTNDEVWKTLIQNFSASFRSETQEAFQFSVLYSLRTLFFI